MGCQQIKSQVRTPFDLRQTSGLAKKKQINKEVLKTVSRREFVHTKGIGENDRRKKMKNFLFRFPIEIEGGEFFFFF